MPFSISSNNDPAAYEKKNHSYSCHAGVSLRLCRKGRSQGGAGRGGVLHRRWPVALGGRYAFDPDRSGHRDEGDLRHPCRLHRRGARCVRILHQPVLDGPFPRTGAFLYGLRAREYGRYADRAARDGVRTGGIDLHHPVLHRRKHVHRRPGHPDVREHRIHYGERR